MSGYSVSKLIQPGTGKAFIEGFFTVKNKDLFFIVPAFSSSIRLRDFKPAAGTTVSVLGNNKTLPFKQAGKDCILDLSGLKPGEVPPELLVIKLKDAL
jgi:alpha-L-fucosidase